MMAQVSMQLTLVVSPRYTYVKIYTSIHTKRINTVTHININSLNEACIPH
jgi:hypothetical protein